MKSLEDIGTGACSKQGRKNETQTSPFFGASIELENEDDDISIYRIVGPDELDHGEHYISVDSPLAKALMKKMLGDEVTVEVPSGRTIYIINQISY